MDSAVNGARSRRRWLVLLAWSLLLLLAWALWLWYLDASDLTFDETATYVVAHRPPLEILRYLQGAVREHPPVYYLMMRAWMALVGVSEFSMRLFSVCAGLLGLVLTGWLARLIQGRSGRISGLLVAALLAVIPGMAYYVREARMYSLGVVWMALSAGVFLRDWLPSKAWPGPGALVGLLVVHSLALFTHYYLLFPILAQPLVLLLHRRWKPLLAWCGIHGLPALGGFLWLQLAPGLQMTAGGLLSALAFPSPTRFELLYLLGKLMFSPFVRVSYARLTELLFAICLGMVLALWHRRAVGTWLAISLLLPLALVHIVPHPPAPRFLVFLMPHVALALGFACEIPCCAWGLLWGSPRGPEEGTARRSRRGLLATLGRPARTDHNDPKPQWPCWVVSFALALLVIVRLLIGGGLQQALAVERSRYGRTVETVQAHARPGDRVLFYGPWQWVQFEYYGVTGLPPITTLPPVAPPRLNSERAEPVLHNLLERSSRLWVLPAAVDDVDPKHFVSGWLRTHAHSVWHTEEFDLYLPLLPTDAPVQAVGLSFAGERYLEKVAYEPTPVSAGEALRLALYWRSLVDQDRDVQLTLSLIDRGGRVWDEAVSTLGARAASPATRQPGALIDVKYSGLRVPQGAPPGEYAVRMLVTDRATGEPLSVEGRKEVDLLTIQVAGPACEPVLYGLPNPDAAVFCSPDEETCLRLAGYEPGGIRFQQGHSVPFQFHWLVPQDGVAGSEMRWRVLHRPWLPMLEGAPVATRTLSLEIDSSAAPPSTDQPDIACHPEASGGQPKSRLLTQQTAITLPPDASTGRARIVLEVLGSDGKPWLTGDGDPVLPLSDIVIEGRPVMRRLPAGLTPLQVDFGDEMGLRGYRVDGEARPGGEIRVTYAWYARTRPTAIYSVFNHLVNTEGAMVAQTDGWPQAGRMLTIQWQKGEYIEDTHSVVIPADAAPGPYTLYVGLYDAATGVRQPAYQKGLQPPDDRIPIPLSPEERR